MCKLRRFPRLGGVSRADEVERDPRLLLDNLMGPGLFYRLERHQWMDLWRAPVFEAIEDCGIEMRCYGPILGFVIADEPQATQFNLLLGAARPGVVESGLLGEALDWTESLGVDCRVPIRPDLGEPDAAEAHLAARGYRSAATSALFVRGKAPPDFPAPAGIEVEELSEEVEGFTDFHLPRDKYGFSTADKFLVGLPAHRYWRCYLAIDEHGAAIASATTMGHYEAAQLAFAATGELDRGRGAHLALLHRRIADALAAGADQLFAITEESLDFPEDLSAAARNLTRAGFRLAGTRTVWRPPAELVAGAGAGDEDEDEDELDDWGGGHGIDDHDFKLEG